MLHGSHKKYYKQDKQTANNRSLTYAVTAMAVAEPLFTLPQAYNVWVRHETAGVSIATWAFFTFAALIWLAYGMAIKNVPLIISSILWAVLEGGLVVGLLIR